MNKTVISSFLSNEGSKTSNLIRKDGKIEYYLPFAELYNKFPLDLKLGSKWSSVIMFAIKSLKDRIKSLKSHGDNIDPSMFDSIKLLENLKKESSDFDIKDAWVFLWKKSNDSDQRTYGMEFLLDALSKVVKKK